MKKSLTTVILTTLSLLLAGCCSNAQLRFWKVRDASGGAISYTVDTAAVPATSLAPNSLRFLDAAGNEVKVANPKPVREMSEPDWKTATSGAGYSLRYCGLRKACWAKAKAR